MKEFIGGKVFVLNPAGKLLILRRSKTAPHRALQWDLPGGWVESGEDPLAACAREVLEEAGIVVGDIKEVMRTTEQRDSEKLIHVYAKTHVLSDDVKLSYEHDQFMWVDTAEYLKHMTYPPYVEAFKAL